ncbi:PREDICTED: uncharacterized protein LOC109162348 [Ipomoea nil]|uniref:uncharacterized protein LOC109162348 n=1 Tax=Ipomoea nil TaxID=35883 RepID=UPI00090102BF|nr:PREDICTED: uncharacterized protein LOC109162348 [Ipomoea nil]
MGLFEPKVSGNHANAICSKLGFPNWIRVEAFGYSGGIWVFWKDSIHVSVFFTHPQFLLLQITEAGKPPWFFAPVYGSPVHHLRRRLWKYLNQTNRNISGPWLVAGDFNTVTHRDETLNYLSYSSQRSSDFVNWIQDEGLIDLGFAGPKLTWVKDGASDHIKGARLDRAMCNISWRLKYPDVCVTHLPRFASDHAPILINLEKRAQPLSPACFLFQAAWTTHPDWQNVVTQTWSHEKDLQNNLQDLASKLTGWNKTVFGNIFKRKRELLARLGGIQRRLEITYHRGLASLQRKLTIQLEDVLYQEELMWFQQSRE